MIIYDANAPQRMSLLTGIPDLLREFGVPLEGAIAGLPIDASIFSDPERRIPYSLASEILFRCATIADCPHFGLLLGSRYDHRCLGAPGLWMQNAANLEAALSGFVQLQQTNSRGASVYLHRYVDYGAVFGYGIYDRSAVAHPVVYGLIEALCFNVVRALTNGVALPSEILFSFRKPRDVDPYVRFFGIPVHFDQPQSGLVIPFSALGAPIPGARAEDLVRLKREAAEASPPSDHVWTDRVRPLIRPLFLRGEVTTQTAAARLGLSVRALSRRLETEGTTFHRILDDIRYTAACELLTVTDLPIGDIADALSYSAHAPFVDAFRRWSGITPSEWRRAIREQ
jgi:AraC-like DNA-binding protein